MRRFKTVAAVVISATLASFSVTTAWAQEEPPVGTQETSTEAPTTETTVVVTTEPLPEETTTSEATPEQTTTSEATVSSESPAVVAVDDSVETSSTANPNQIDQDQTVVITATVVAGANSGSNSIVDNQPDQGGSQQPAEVDTGDATAVGSDDENVITQAADIVLAEGARANVVQVALILNIGVALANSGGNIVSSTPGGSGTSGQIGTGDASATGLDIGQYITQAARENGDENTDAQASQIAISLWMGVAGANSGTNVISGTGVAGSGGSVGSGNASATGNESLTEIEQYADILGVDQSTINVTQQATVLNVGFALSNTGLNDVSGVASGLLTASESDDDAVAQELFAMLLPALLQSYGYGPAQGSINTGDATAVGNDSETFIRQVAMAASSGDGQVDIVQNVLVANMGAAAANTGGNTLGNVRTLDAETANAVVTMAAFMSELLAQVHHSANDTAFEARSVGIEIPFQGLILRLDGAFEGLDTEVEQNGTRANVRQVSIVVSLGISLRPTPAATSRRRRPIRATASMVSKRVTPLPCSPSTPRATSSGPAMPEPATTTSSLSRASASTPTTWIAWRRLRRRHRQPRQHLPSPRRRRPIPESRKRAAPRQPARRHRPRPTRPLLPPLGPAGSATFRAGRCQRRAWIPRRRWRSGRSPCSSVV